MTRHLYILTGHCPITEAEMRLEEADRAEDEGRYRAALEWRAIVARMRRDKAKRGQFAIGPDPDALVPSMDGLTFMDLDGPYDARAVCPCGHFATFLCDEPIGRGKTCDKPLCKCCRVPVATEIDQCDFHARTDARIATPASGAADSR